jgi:hypothetical protein
MISLLRRMRALDCLALNGKLLEKKTTKQGQQAAARPWSRVALPGDSDAMSYLGRALDPPPLKWSDLRYVFDIQEDCNGKEAIQA